LKAEMLFLKAMLPKPGLKSIFWLKQGPDTV
jgi:hypothetical protein